MPVESSTPDQDLAPVAELKLVSSLYALLALTMRYPDPSFCNTQLLDTLESLLESLEWQEALTDYREWRKATPDFLNDLRTEYTRLFITASPRTTIPPYASIYIDGSGILCGPTTERTRDFYREYGYDLADTTELADHISIELDFLAAVTAEGQAEAEEQFLQTLFRPWFERFQQSSIKEARHPFYQVSIQLIDFFTKEEQ